MSASGARTVRTHAIAVLTGHPPADLTIAPRVLAKEIPQIPTTVPAALLERRPDIAAAERAMQQQNALIGAAIAAYYPDISLTALYGYVGNPIGSLDPGVEQGLVDRRKQRSKQCSTAASAAARWPRHGQCTTRAWRTTARSC